MKIVLTESQLIFLTEKLRANVIGKDDGAEVNWDKESEISKKKEVMIDIDKLIYHQPVKDEKDKGYQKIVKSLMKKYEEKDYMDPLFIYKHGKGTYKILDGHHRVSALKKLGRDKVNCLIVPKENVEHKDKFSDEKSSKKKSD
jgi:hypothetical protein